MKIDKALQVAVTARIRRHIPSSNSAAATAPNDNTDEQAASSERPVRDVRGRFVKGHVNVGGAGLGPLRDRFVAALFAHWRREGRKALRRLAEKDPRAYIELVGAFVRRMSK